MNATITLLLYWSMMTLFDGDNMIDAIIIILLSFVALSIVGSVALFILTIVAQFWRKP